MIRHALIALVLLATTGLTADTQKPACVPVSVQQMTLQAKSEEWVHMVKVYMPVNIFKARHDAVAALRNQTVITKALAVPTVKPKAKPLFQTASFAKHKTKVAKLRKSACGSRRQVWRTLANGHRKYRCLK